jgi:DNA-binding response OmpR family regulator
MTKSKSHDERILVVDDEPMMSDSLRRHLMNEGYALIPPRTAPKRSICLTAAPTTW